MDTVGALLWLSAITALVLAATVYFLWQKLRKYSENINSIALAKQERYAHYASVLENTDDVAWLFIR